MSRIEGPVMENQMDKPMENDMDTVIMCVNMSLKIWASKNWDSFCGGSLQ